MSRLPPPPRGKAPAPEPSSIPSDAPPPLPSRPGGKAGPPKRLASPPKPNGMPPAQDTPDDYLEPDDWTTGGGPQAPALPPRNFDEDEGGELYEEPDQPQVPQKPAPSRPVHHQAPPPVPPQDGEIYDELDQGAAPEPSPPPPIMDEPGEVYDACNFEDQGDDEGELYQEPDAAQDQQDQTYEFVPEPVAPKAPKAPEPPPMINSVPPSRPKKAMPPAPTPSQDHSPDLPERPTAKIGKKVLEKSTQPAAGVISLNELSQGKSRLKSVNSEERQEPPPPPTETNNETDFDSGSVLQKALRFQENHDTNHTGVDLQNEILNARNMLRSSAKVKPKPIPNTNKPKLLNPSDEGPKKPITRPTSGLTIQERIALMQGKQVDHRPEPSPRNISPTPATRHALKPPPTPLKPKKSDHVTQSDHVTGSDNVTSSDHVTSSAPSQQTQGNQRTWQIGSVQDKKEKPTPPRKVQERTPSPTLPPPPAPAFEEDDIYDEGFSYMDPLQGQEWFHGRIDRHDTTDKLKTIAEDGTFLVRNASKDDPYQPYTLVVLYRDREYNLKIRKRMEDNHVALGEKKEAEMAFANVPALIEHHKGNEVILVNKKENKQYQTILKKFPSSRR